MRGILDFLVKGTVDVESCYIIDTHRGETFSKWLSDLQDDTECADSEFLAFFSPEESHGDDLRQLEELSGGETPDYELPTSEGWWTVLRIEG